MTPTQIMTDWFEQVWNNGNTAHIDEFLAPKCCVAGLSGEINSPLEFHALHTRLNSVLKDFNCRIVRSIESGNEVAGIVMVQATDIGTGKTLEIPTSFIATVEDGKITDCLNTVDFMNLFSATGLLDEEKAVRALGA